VFRGKRFRDLSDLFDKIKLDVAYEEEAKGVAALVKALTGLHDKQMEMIEKAVEETKPSEEEQMKQMSVEQLEMRLRSIDGKAEEKDDESDG
jgi:hypothetical protein